MFKFSSMLSVALLLACAACSKPKLDPPKLEATIKEGLKAKDITVKSVSCPPREIKQGDSFDCEAVTDDGEKTAIKVDQTDDQGNVNWKTTAVLGSQAKLASQLITSLGKGATAKCPDKTIIVKKGTSFTCDGNVEGKAAKITFNAKDDEGNFHMNAKFDGEGAPVESEAKE